jgi:hypothetical protein
VETVITKATRLTGYLLVAGMAVWLGRLFAHSKTPPPEGRWREVTEAELSS